MYLKSLLILFISFSIQLYILTRPLPSKVFQSVDSRCNPFKCLKPHLTTKDGYLISSFRILGKSPVLVIPRFSGSGEDFLLTFEDTSLGHFLASLGLDVSLLNLRGSLHHESLNPSLNNSNSQTFWKFTPIESLSLDLQAYLQMLVKSTNTSKVNLIVFGEYGSIVAALLAAQVEMSKMVKKVVWIGPGCRSLHQESLVNRFLTSKKGVEILKLLGIQKVFGKRSVFFGQLVEVFPFVLNGFGKHGRIWEDCRTCSFYEILATENVSVESLEFWERNDGGRRMEKLRDFGKERNLKVYGRDSPPFLNFSRIQQDFHLFLSSQCEIPEFLKDLRGERRIFPQDLSSLVFSKDASYHQHLKSVLTNNP